MEHCGSKSNLKVEAEVIRGGSANIGSPTFTNVYDIECIGPDGEVKWTDKVYNTVVNVGLDDVLDVYFKGSAVPTAHYVGLITGPGATVLAAETMASKAWSEDTTYSESVRETLILGTVASQSVDNSASKASFSINGTATIGGIFIAESSTKSETASLLYGGGAFTGGDKSVSDGDTLNVTVTLTAASA